MSTGRILALAAAACVLIACAAFTARRLDATAPSADPYGYDESFYLTPGAARRAAFSFNGVAADWYWMRSLQYVGKRVISHEGENLNLDDLSSLKLKALTRYLEMTTELDPQFMAPYEYAAVVLSALDRPATIRILDRGIAANPHAWRLYQHKGYVLWQEKKYDEASAAYQAGSSLPNAPGWMKMMAALMKAEGGSRNVARQMYQAMHDESDDPQFKELAINRLAWLKAIEDLEIINPTLQSYSARNGRCPASLSEIAREVQGPIPTRNGIPLDPSGIPYELDTAACRAAISKDSTVPRK